MRPESTTSGCRVSWSALLAMVLVPLLVVASLIGFTRAGGTSSVNAAIVNLDQMVTINGQQVPMGRQLAAAMIERKGQNINWTLADAAGAKAGLASGEYAAVVTIPESFSASATSFSANDAAKAMQATVQIQVSDNAPVTDSALAQEIARLATDTINSTLTQGYLDNIYIGFNTVKDQFSSIVDGASQLNDGGSKLAAGVTASTQGTNQLAAGMQQLKTNSPKLTQAATQLDTGGQELLNGGSRLAGGIADLSKGADQLKAGSQQLRDGLAGFKDKSGELVSGIDQLADGAKPLLGGLPEYTAGVKQAIGGVGELKGGIDQMIGSLPTETDTSQLQPLVEGSAGLAAGLQQIDEQLKKFTSGEAPLPPEVAAAGGQAADLVVSKFDCAKLGPQLDPATCGMLQQAFAQGATAGAAAGAVAGFRVGTGAGSAMLNTPDPKSNKTLLAGSQELAAGLAGLPAQLAAQSKQQIDQLRGGLQQLADGAGQLITKAQPLVDNADSIGAGATKLQAGLDQLKTQVKPLPAGVSQLHDGASKLHTGVTGVATGASGLNTGVGGYTQGVTKYVDGVGQFAQGVDQYTTGVDSAADGAQKLSAGSVQLEAGAKQLSEGLGSFASKLREGAQKVPTYSADQRKTLSSVVANPVAKSDQLITGGSAPLLALLLVAGLWLGALASFVVVRPTPSNLVSSREASLTLWARTLAVPAAITAGQALVLGVLGAVLLKLDISRSVGLIALLVLLGLAFVVVNHALAAWLGNIGRGISLLLLSLTVALGLSSTTPSLLAWVASVSPVQTGLVATRAWLAAGSGRVALLGWVLLIGCIATGCSLAAIAARRKLTANQFRRRLTAG